MTASRSGPSGVVLTTALASRIRPRIPSQRFFAGDSPNCSNAFRSRWIWFYVSERCCSKAMRSPGVVARRAKSGRTLVSCCSASSRSLSSVTRCVLSVCGPAIIESFPLRGPNGQRDRYIGCARSVVNGPSRARPLARQALQQPRTTQRPASNRVLFGPTPLELMRRITCFGRSKLPSTRFRERTKARMAAAAAATPMNATGTTLFLTIFHVPSRTTAKPNRDLDVGDKRVQFVEFAFRSPQSTDRRFGLRFKAFLFVLGFFLATAKLWPQDLLAPIRAPCSCRASPFCARVIFFARRPDLHLVFSIPR
jgi:hypothetical protein